MIDSPPTDATKPGPPAKTTVGWLTVPSHWTMMQDKFPIFQRAQKAFNSEIDIVPSWCVAEHVAEAVLRLNELAGLIVFVDPASRIPPSYARVISFFFGRDKAEACVYVWRPFEKDFRLIDDEWLDLRRE